MMRFALFLFVVLPLVLACSRSDGPPPKPTSEPAVAAASSPPESVAKGTPEQEPPGERREVAVLAGGCFWGMEELLRKQPGVVETTVGYAGGSLESPSYEDVKRGSTGHAESVEIVYDPEVTSFERLLLYFFRIHDPTTKDRQGNDVGTQYRSAIFVQNAEQRAVAERVIERVEASGAWDAPIRTRIEEGSFYPAEGYHQDYLQRIPNGYTCHYERDISI